MPWIIDYWISALAKIDKTTDEIVIGAIIG